MVLTNFILANFDWLDNGVPVRQGYHIESTLAFKDVKPSDYVGLFVSGGRAPEYLRYDKDLINITRSIYNAGKPIASLCHGIEILTAADIIRGIKVCTVNKCAMDAQQGGGIFSGDKVIIDGQFVTAGGWQNNSELLRGFLELLNKK